MEAIWHKHKIRKFNDEALLKYWMYIDLTHVFKMGQYRCLPFPSIILVSFLMYVHDSKYYEAELLKQKHHCWHLVFKVFRLFYILEDIRSGPKVVVQRNFCPMYIPSKDSVLPFHTLIITSASRTTVPSPIFFWRVQIFYREFFQCKT